MNAADSDHVFNVSRRTFLGVAGASISAGVTPTRPDGGGGAPVATEPLFRGSIRQIAIDPGHIGAGWKLAIDEVAVVSGDSVCSIDSGHSTIAFLKSIVPDNVQLWPAFAELHASVHKRGLVAYSELDYSLPDQGSYEVKIGVFEAIQQAESFLKMTFVDPRNLPDAGPNLDVAGYRPMDGLGDEAYESLGGWSLPGKIRFRRANVFVAVVPFLSRGSAPSVATAFDALICTRLSCVPTA